MWEWRHERSGELGGCCWPPLMRVLRGSLYRRGSATKVHFLTIVDMHTQELPTPVEALRHKAVAQVSCGSGHTVVLTDDGEVRGVRVCACML